VVRTVVIAPAETLSITMTGLFDVIGKADRAYGALRGRPGHDTAFDVQLASLDGGPVRHGDRVTVNADLAAEQVHDVDLVVVPGLDDDLEASLALNQGWAPWLAQWHEAGAVVASSCSGAFLVAEAGILDGRSATTHWLYGEALQRRYPAVRVTTERLLIDHGDVITSGGATTFLDLALYLVERFAGHERANAAARILLIDGARTSQLPYVSLGGGALHDHGDEAVCRAQDLIDSDLGGDLRVEALARAVGVSSRTLDRRFLDSVGQTPQAYIRARRVDTARRMLETSDTPVDSIRRRVGYSDAAAFRRAFRHHAGLSPTDYRRRFGWPAGAAHGTA
jgi:transcriptional regulator GlxA family with amidase domain